MDSILSDFAEHDLTTFQDILDVDSTPAVARAGDLFVLGKHRLLAGDALEAASHAALLRGEDLPIWPSWIRRTTSRLMAMWAGAGA